MSPIRFLSSSLCQRFVLVTSLGALLCSTGLPRAAAIESRPILKSYFQTGDKPTAPQFNALIDSVLHHTEDRDLLGLRMSSDGGAALLPAGTLIGPGSIFGPAEGLSSEWTGQSGYLGLSFSEGPLVFYGYLQMSGGPTDPYPMSVDYLVWNDQPGMPLLTTSVPEPSAVTLALMGLLALPWGARRLRRGSV